MLKQIFVLLLLIATVLAETAYFAFTTFTGPDFIVKFTRDHQIRHARRLLRGYTNEFPHIAGGIVKKRIGYNQDYNYYLHSYTVDFVEADDMSSCDSGFLEVELDIEGACNFSSSCYLCFGRSRIVAEIYYSPRQEFDIQEGFRTGEEHLSNEIDCS